MDFVGEIGLDEKICCIGAFSFFQGTYYYGNCLPQVLAGWLATKYGFKRVKERK